MPGADKEKVVAVIAQRLGVTPEYALELTERAEEIFLSNTGRQIVPVKAFWLWVDISTAIHNQDTASTGEGGTASSGKISSIKRGDTTIQYNHTSAESMINLLPDLLSRIHWWRVAKAR